MCGFIRLASYMEVLKCEAEIKMGNGHWGEKKKALAQKTNCLPHTYA